jgi:uncharacterized repeat protein (TIGR03917 family)
MPIFPTPGNPWRNPHEGRPLATVRQNQRGDYEVTLKPGADVADLADVLGTIPANAIFMGEYSDIDTVLVFRPVPGSASMPAVPRVGGPAGSDAVARSIPTGPIDRVPTGLAADQFGDAVRGALAGVQLGRYDEHVMGWLAGRLDAPTVITIVSLVRRARRAELAACLSS